MFAVFDRNALMAELKKEDNKIKNITTFGDSSDQAKYDGSKKERAKVEAQLQKGRFSPEEFNRYLNDAIQQDGEDVDNITMTTEARYADQLLPFNITINFANEMGNKAKLTIYGVDILNEGMGFSIQDLSTNVQYSFVATDIKELEALDSQD